MLDDYGLVPTLQWYLAEQAQRATLSVEVSIDPDFPRLPIAIEVACFRVVQEAVTNVVRHAKAHHISVSLRQREGALTLTVRDDGQGFDLPRALSRAAKGKSMGLLSMRERVQLLGGAMAIESRPGEGTSVSALIPMNQPEFPDEAAPETKP
jgi:two-component system sensor histidine kinase UhpB